MSKKKKKRTVKPMTRLDEKANLISKGTNINVQKCADFLHVPAGFIRQYWKDGTFMFEQLETWIRSARGKELLQQWDRVGGRP